MRPVLLFVALFAVLVALTSTAHRHVAAWAPRETAQDEIRFLPSGKALGVVSLGYEELVADLLWARATLMFGERFGEDEDATWYAWLYHMMDLATDLDPSFRAAYKYGGTMLRVNGDFVEQSSMIFRKGMHHIPGEWYLPFGIAMNYFLHKDDKALAAEYMQVASRIPGAPFYLRNLAATLTDEGQGLENSLTFLLEELRALPEGKAKAAIEVKIFETRYLIAERDATAVIADFRRQTGRLPTAPDGVANAGLVLPADPLGGAWAWSEDPEAAPGQLRSSRYYAVFSEMASRTGLGVLATPTELSSGPVGPGMERPSAVPGAVPTPEDP